jgi:hypothetical protein
MVLMVVSNRIHISIGENPWGEDDLTLSLRVGTNSKF